MVALEARALFGGQLYVKENDSGHDVRAARHPALIVDPKKVCRTKHYASPRGKPVPD
jgi:hypothetical protein